MSFVSYLVFHHSVRIRLKSDALDEKKDDKKTGKDRSGGTSTQASTTPAATDAESIQGEGSESVSSGPTISTEPAPEGGHVKEKTGALVGKINNLVTSDLATIEDSYRVVDVCECVQPFLR